MRAGIKLSQFLRIFPFTLADAKADSSLCLAHMLLSVFRRVAAYCLCEHMRETESMQYD